MATVKKVRSSRTKAEVQEEFLNLAERCKAAKESSSSISESALFMREAEVRNAVSGITVEVITQKIAELSSEISRSLTSISEKMGSEVNMLMNLQEAAKIEAKELTKLHSIDIAATAIDQLIADYHNKKLELEAEMTSAHQQWSIEQKERDKTCKEFEENLKKTRVREQEEHEYKKISERKKIEDKYEEERYLRAKQNMEKQEALEKDWAEREAQLKAQENEIVRLREEVEQFPAKLSRKCDEAAHLAASDAERKCTQEIANLKKDILVEKQIAELKIKGLHETIASQQNQVHSLHAQLEDAKKQVQDIALKAIEGASGANALSHINKIAIEQAKNRGTTA